MTVEFPQNPYPITGILYILGSGASGIAVRGTNLTSGDTEEVTTESDGSFIIDPANMGVYSDGDIIRISSGSWYIDVAIDLTNYPGGIEKDIKKSISVVHKIVSKGTSLERGISCGR